MPSHISSCAVWPGPSTGQYPAPPTGPLALWWRSHWLWPPSRSSSTHDPRVTWWVGKNYHVYISVYFWCFFIYCLTVVPHNNPFEQFLVIFLPSSPDDVSNQCGYQSMPAWVSCECCIKRNRNGLKKLFHTHCGHLPVCQSAYVWSVLPQGLKHSDNKTSCCHYPYPHLQTPYMILTYVFMSNVLQHAA